MSQNTVRFDFHSCCNLERFQRFYLNIGRTLTLHGHFPYPHAGERDQVTKVKYADQAVTLLGMTVKGTQVPEDMNKEWTFAGRCQGGDHDQKHFTGDVNFESGNGHILIEVG